MVEGERMAVYVIRDVLQGCCKIGWSNDPVARLATLLTGSPNELELLCQIPGGRALEARLHLQFRDKHRRREWFDLDEVDLAAIREIKGTRPEARRPRGRRRGDIYRVPGDENSRRRGLSENPLFMSLFEAAVGRKMTWDEACKALGISRRTYYLLLKKRKANNQSGVPNASDQ
jgi:hypothetical protein